MSKCKFCGIEWNPLFIFRCNTCKVECDPVCMSNSQHVEKGHSVIDNNCNSITMPGFGDLCDHGHCGHFRYLHTKDKGCIVCQARNMPELQCNNFLDRDTSLDSLPDSDKFWFAFDQAIKQTDSNEPSEEYTDAIAFAAICRKLFGWSDEKITTMTRQAAAAKRVQWIKRSLVDKTIQGYSKSAEGVVLLKLSTNI